MATGGASRLWKPAPTPKPASSALPASSSVPPGVPPLPPALGHCDARRQKAAQRSGRKRALRGQGPWAQVLAPPLPGRAPSGTFLDLLVPQFPHL